MRVAVFGTYDTRLHPRGAVLVEGLLEHGAHVVELNEPLRLDTRDRVAMLREPWRLPLLASRLAGCWWRLLLRSISVPRPDAVLVPYLGHFDVLLARARWPRRRVVLDYLVSGAATARDRGVTGGLKLGFLTLLDRAAAGVADIVVVDTHESRARLPARARERAVVVPVGATATWFAAGVDVALARGSSQDESPLDPLRVIFFGSFTPLQGTVTIARALSRLRQGLVQVTMVGSGQDHAEVRRILADRTDVEWRHWVPMDRLAGLVAEHDVCLGIFGTTEKGMTVVPNKIYQGAAAGCALVTSDTEPHRRALGDAALYVPPGDDAALAQTLRTLVEDRAVLVRLREAAADRARSFTAARAVAPLFFLLETSH